MDLKVELNKIKEYLKSDYDLDATIERYIYIDDDAVYYRKGKLELIFHLSEPDEECYLPEDYTISFDYNNKANWSGGGYMEKYNSDDYSNIDEFMSSRSFKKSQIRQQSLF